jgi:uncharacterized membrane protein (DUF4010 family)
MDVLEKIPAEFINFIIVLLFSLLIGLEQRRLISSKSHQSFIFGTDRTFTFIGILGFILYILDPVRLILFCAGLIVLGVMFSIYYFKKTEYFRSFGMTSIIVALLTYSLAPVVITQPRWLLISIVVSILILVELKDHLTEFTSRVDNREFITIAKFLIIAGVVLPLVPNTPVVSYISITPYQIWLSIVVVSAISYLSYLLQKFVFKKSGLVVSGLLGGLYSSTATTLILSRKSKEVNSGEHSYASSIIFATAMMYVRIMVLMFIFNLQLGLMLLPYLGIMILASLAAAIIVLYIKKPSSGSEAIVQDRNPLELKVAALFAFLFTFFSVVTYYVLRYYGNMGLNVLSYVVGFTDIDPYLLNLFQGKYNIALTVVGTASFQAIISNNILKMIYCLIFSDKITRKAVAIGLGVVTLLNILLMIFL